LLKITSLNSAVIAVRLIISVFLRKLMAQIVGEEGISQIGSLRNLMQMCLSLGTLGVFNGVVKYVSEYKEDSKQLQRLFSTAFVFTLIGTSITSLTLLIFAPYISEHFFQSDQFIFLVRLLAIIVPFMVYNRAFQGIINGLSKYKQYSKIEFFAYLLSSVLTAVFLIQYNLSGVLVAIAITPVIQLVILLYVFTKILKEYIQVKEINLKAYLAKPLLAFTVMSFTSTFILNYVELDIRRIIAEQYTQVQAGVWTAMTDLSKNYMVFANALFTLYVIPKFASIHSRVGFFKEVRHIYKTLLPLFGLGMLIIYVFRNIISDFIFEGFEGLSGLFKWQLLGDFVKLASAVLAHQFLAKRLVRNFIFTELFSLALFYILAKVLSAKYGIEGVVIGHFLRYLIYFVVVAFLVFRYFKKKEKKDHI